MLFVLAIVLASLQAPADTREALARLESDSGAERADAERWLSANLDARDFALVAEATTRGSLEARARLVHALGSDQRHFDLALLLSLDREPGVRRMGREALERQAGSWFGPAVISGQARSDAALELELYGRFAGRFSVRPLEHDLDELLDLLARLAPPARATALRDGGLALAVDSVLYADPPDSALRAASQALLEGSFDELLFDALEGRGVRMQGFGFDGPHPWLCVLHAPDAGDATALEHIWRWCREVGEYGDRPRGAGAARALAACGWPAPLAWLERRWLATRDRNALAGLLTAASRGRVVGSLCTGAMVGELVALADAACAGASSSDARWSREIARGLARVPRIGRDKEDLTQVVLAGWSEASEPGRTWRANVIAGMGRADERWRSQVREQLVRSGSSLAPVTRLACLRALAATEVAAVVEPWSVAADRALFELIVRDRAQAQFLAQAQLCGARPPAAWRDGSEVDLGGAREHALAVLWMGVRDEDLDDAVELARLRWSAEGWPVELGDELAARVALGDTRRVEALCARLESAAKDDPRAELVALFAGVLPAERCKARLSSLLSIASPADADLPEIAAALTADVGDELTERAVKVLLARVTNSFKPVRRDDGAWIAACERATRNLLVRGETSYAALLVREIKAVLSTHEHPLRKPLRENRWPRPTGPEPESLEALDAPFER